MAFNINTFKSEALKLGGARPALFEVRFTVPPQIGAEAGSDLQFSFNCKAAALPAASVSPVEIGYFGRKIKIAGDRTFTDWSVTILNDEDFLVRSLFEKWSNAINSLESNVRKTSDSFGTDGAGGYKADLTVYQYGKTGAEIRAYDIIGAFPTNIDAINLDWDTTNQVEQFGVTFAYDYWLPRSELENTNPYYADARTPIL